MVISLNVQRRDLTAAQRAIVAARTTNAERGRPAKNGSEGTVFTVDAVAKIFKVGVRQVKEAKALLTEAPDLAKRVEACTLALAVAYELLQERRKEAEQKAKDAALVEEFTEAISNGEMTMEDAIQQALARERDRSQAQAAQADARHHWLKELAAFITWTEVFVGQRNDEHLTWYTLPDSPGLYEHGLTADRVREAARQLERVCVHTFGDQHGTRTDKGGRRQGGGRPAQ
jgi:hypothetical protein